MIKATDSDNTTNGSTFNPGDSSVYRPMTSVSTLAFKFIIYNVRSMVLVLPPAPAARVLAGRAFATLSCLSAAARLRRSVRGPPGGVGELGREDPEATGESTAGEDYTRILRVSYCLLGFELRNRSRHIIVYITHLAQYACSGVAF